MRSVIATGVSVLVVAACSKEAPKQAVDAGASPTASASVSAAPPSKLASRLVDRTISDDERMVLAWNAALNAHSGADLGKLYAPKVKLYGRDMTRAAAVKAKEAALASEKEFAQIVSGVKPGAGGKVSFLKTVTANGATRGYPAYLVLSADKKEILEESDEITDKNLAATNDAEGRCARAVGDVVAASKKGKEMLSAPIDPAMKKDQGCTSLGYMPFPPEPGERFAAVRFHASCTERLAFHGWLYVSTKDGCVYEDKDFTGNESLFVRLECPDSARDVPAACGVR